MKKFTFLASTMLLLFGNDHLYAQRIAVTVAGNGTAAFTGDGGAARSAAVTGLKDVCTDAAQNLYFTDLAGGRIRKLTTKTGVITTIAGGGTSTADGVPATSAALRPAYLCISSSNMLYVTTQNEVRKINLATGIITTVAGSTDSSYSGDGGGATAATFRSPQGICIDGSGNLYVADRWNNRIRKITATTGIISTVAGNGTASESGDGGPATAATLFSPITVCLNATGDLFISDQEPNYPDVLSSTLVRKVSAGSGTISVVLGESAYSSATYGVSALNAFLGTITGMCIDSWGNLYCNEMSCSCRDLDVTTDTLDLVAGNFGSESYTDDTACFSANMNLPMGICMDRAGNVYIADSANNRVRKLIQLTHTPTFAFGPGQFIVPVSGTANSIDSLLWITDLDPAQTETWTIVAPPVHGALAGFPTAAVSNGTLTTTNPTGLSYTPLASYAGSDVFKVRVSDGALSDTITVYVGAGSLIDREAVNNTLSPVSGVTVFPNPATSVLNIQWTSVATRNAPVTIFDVTGHTVFETILPGNSNDNGSAQIDISSMPAGVYFVKLSGADVTKIVKE